jgi:hypothetical protein
MLQFSGYTNLDEAVTSDVGTYGWSSHFAAITPHQEPYNISTPDPDIYRRQEHSTFLAFCVSRTGITSSLVGH